MHIFLARRERSFKIQVVLLKSSYETADYHLWKNRSCESICNIRLEQRIRQIGGKAELETGTGTSFETKFRVSVSRLRSNNQRYELG